MLSAAAQEEGVPEVQVSLGTIWCCKAAHQAMTVASSGGVWQQHAQRCAGRASSCHALLAGRVSPRTAGHHAAADAVSALLPGAAIQDKINAFWEITKKDLEDRRADLRNKDREMEEMEERHMVEVKVGAEMGAAETWLSVCWCGRRGPCAARVWRMSGAHTTPRPHPPTNRPTGGPARRARRVRRARTRTNARPQVYKQKVKHLLFEHQNNISTLKADGELALKLQQDDFLRREGQLSKDKRSLKKEIKEQVGLRWLGQGEVEGAAVTGPHQLSGPAGTKRACKGRVL